MKLRGEAASQLGDTSVARQSSCWKSRCNGWKGWCNGWKRRWRLGESWCGYYRNAGEPCPSDSTAIRACSHEKSARILLIGIIRDRA
jgi:hypothetical protein